MSKEAIFQVYSASAGSGKTFTLVKEYLKILLQSNNKQHFKKILAITFTNKAANEMKERIIDTLQAFARGENSDLLQPIFLETGLEQGFIQKKSQKIIKAILNDYSGLSITTIDSFTHRIIRSFAYDFGLSLNFEVEMDAATLLQEAVDAVIDNIGVNEQLSKALIQYALSKSNDDKAWDITRDIFEFSKLLLNESDSLEFKNIEDKNFEDYIALQKSLNQKSDILAKRLAEIGQAGSQIIEDSGLQASDFYYSALPKHFNNLKVHWKRAKFFEQSILRKRIEENVFYSKSKPEHVKQTIENLLPQLLDLYFESEEIYKRITRFDLFRQSLIPLAVLSYVNHALENIKSEENIRLINEFNALIFEKIQDEPTPYIYERLGEKYTHFFIDEMQDTSVLQWKNLIKLIDNPLSQEQGSLLLVGDAKQAIYRWRGGVSEQFIDLANPKGSNPFHIPKNVVNLDTNYRSYSEIIQFNNRFFQHIGGLMQNSTYAELYIEGNQQKLNTKIGGYVQIDFLNSRKIKKENPDKAENLYPQKVLEIIQNLSQESKLSDICILVRKNKEAVHIASYLTEHHIPIISSESLLLAKDAYVDFLINLLRIIQQKNDLKTRFKVLYFLFSKQKIIIEKHTFIDRLIHLNEDEFYSQLKDFNIVFDKNIFLQKSLYDAVEYSLRSFELFDKSQVYIQAFLDEVLQFQNKNGSDLHAFLQYWDLHQDKLSIHIPEGENAVQIMSIHKAKGLQFPIVIYPYDLKVNHQIDPRVWYPIEEPEDYQGFEKLLIPYKKDLQYIDETGFNLYYQRQETLELDSFNLLYVTLTRAVEQLYIITEYRLDKKGEENKNYFSGLFMNYLKSQALWQEDQFSYSFGIQRRGKQQKTVKKKDVLLSQKLHSSDLQEHQINIFTGSSVLWGSEKEEARAYGNLIHAILSHIYTQDDIENAVEKEIIKGNINSEEATIIKNNLHNIVNHPELAHLYQHNLQVYNEREICNTELQIFIPDRVVLYPDNTVTIIDYKTGVQESKHKAQVDNYAQLYREMGYDIRSKILVYIGEAVVVEIW